MPGIDGFDTRRGAGIAAQPPQAGCGDDTCASLFNQLVDDGAPGLYVVSCSTERGSGEIW
jgi:hypothetical protein